MLELDDPRWETLKDGRGEQVDLRPLIEDVESAKEPTESWSALWKAVYQEGKIGDSAFATVPHLVRIHLAHGVVNWNTYALVSAIELAQGQGSNPHVPDWAEGAYREALKELANRGLVELPRSKNSETTRSILSLLAIVFGARAYGRVLLELTEDELVELERAAGRGGPLRK